MTTLICGAMGIIFTLELYALNELRKKELLQIEAEEKAWQELFERTGLLIRRVDNLTARTVSIDNLKVVDVDTSRLSAAVVNLSHMSQS